MNRRRLFADDSSESSSNSDSDELQNSHDLPHDDEMNYHCNDEDIETLVSRRRSLMRSVIDRRVKLVHLRQLLLMQQSLISSPSLWPQIFILVLLYIVCGGLAFLFISFQQSLAQTNSSPTL
jgi:hypothetical protein